MSHHVSYHGTKRLLKRNFVDMKVEPENAQGFCY